jgi:hypothetical protein
MSDTVVNGQRGMDNPHLSMLICTSGHTAGTPVLTPDSPPFTSVHPVLTGALLSCRAPDRQAQHATSAGHRLAVPYFWTPRDSPCNMKHLNANVHLKQMKHLEHTLAACNMKVLAAMKHFGHILSQHMCETHMQHPDQNDCNIRLETDKTFLNKHLQRVSKTLTTYATSPDLLL